MYSSEVQLGRRKFMQIGVKAMAATTLTPLPTLAVVRSYREDPEVVGSNRDRGTFRR
jgi:hypothetical protein